MKRIANWICMLALLLLLGACRGDVAQRYYEEGLSLMEEGDAPQALERLRKAADHARTDSLRVAVYSEMGQLLFAEGLQEQALVAFRQAHDADCRLGDTVGLSTRSRLYEKTFGQKGTPAQWDEFILSL